MKRAGRSVLLLGALVAVLLAIGLPTQAAPADYDLPGGGHFYTQTNGGAGDAGYAVTNVDGVAFWNFFQQVGGIPVVGYPVSHRFLWKGFTVQAFQKVVFQWRPEAGTVYYANVLDEMHDAGLDGALQAQLVPPPSDWSGDAGLPFNQVVQRHMAVLASNPAIAAAYNAEPDTLNRNGLPMSIQTLSNVVVVRTQRKVFQQWLVDVPWAKAGQVVTANGGDLAKAAGLYPSAAVTPLPPASAPRSAINAAAPAGPTPTPAGPCRNDEQMTFSPSNPSVGQQVFVNVTSGQASTNIRLDGPFSPQFQGVKTGGKGWIWTWTFTASAPGRADYNFRINGGTSTCSTNNLQVSGAGPTATPLPPTATPAPPAPGPLSCPGGTSWSVSGSPVVNQEFSVALTGTTLGTVQGQGVVRVATDSNSIRAYVNIPTGGQYGFRHVVDSQVCGINNVTVSDAPAPPSPSPTPTTQPTTAPTATPTTAPTVTPTT
jgi:hypothetical protein